MRRTSKILMFLVLFITLSISVNAYGINNGLVDSFNRSDRSISGDTADNGMIWTLTTPAGECTIISEELRYSKVGNNGNCDLYLNATQRPINQSRNITIKWKTANSNNNAWIRFYGDTLLATDQITNFYINGGNIDVLNGDGVGGSSAVTLQTITNNQWYDISLVNVNPSANTFDVKIDNTIYDNGGSHFGYYWNNKEIKRINFITVNTIKNYVDEIRILENLDDPVSPNFTISTTSYWSGNTITNFSALINGTLYDDGDTGTITTDILQNSTSLYNITINTNDWYNETILNVNVSSNLATTLNQSFINITVNKSLSGVGVSDFSVYNGTNLVLNTSNYYGLIHPDFGNYTLTIVDNTGVENYTQDNTLIEVLALDNKTVNLLVSGHTITINATDASDGSSALNFSINVEALDFTSNRNFTTTTGTITFPAVDGSYNITIDAPAFAQNNNNVTIEVLNNQTNFFHNFPLFSMNSFNMTFYDIDTGEIMNGTNITVHLIGGTSTTNITDTGELFLDLLTPSDYTIIYSADEYRQGSYIFTLINRTYNKLNLYMTKENTTSLVLITVLDKFSKDPVQNSLVTVQRYKDDAWVTDQILKTDFNGQTEGYFVVSTVFYNFLVEKDDTVFFGIINSNENKKNIYAEDVSNGIVVEIDSSPNNVIASYQTVYDLVTSCRFTNTSNSTGYFIFTFDDTNNLQRTADLEVKVGNDVNCTNSIVSESGNLNCVVSVDSAVGITTFTARGYVDNKLVEVCTGEIGVDDVWNFNWGVAGFILGLFMVIIAYTAFATMPSVSIMMGTGMFGLGIFFNLFFGNTGIASVLLLVFFAFVLIMTRSTSGVNS